MNHYGRHYTVEGARIYTVPDEPVPVYVSGFGGKGCQPGWIPRRTRRPCSPMWIRGSTRCTLRKSDPVRTTSFSSGAPRCGPNSSIGVGINQSHDGATGDYVLARLRDWQVEQVFAESRRRINGIVTAFVGRADNTRCFVRRAMRRWPRSQRWATPSSAGAFASDDLVEVNVAEQLPRHADDPSEPARGGVLRLPARVQAGAR